MSARHLLLAVALATVPALAAAQRALRSPLVDLGFACDELHYPAAALRAEATGKTIITFVVSDDGLVTRPEVSVSSGRKREHKLLDHAALLHVRSCKPVNGSAVAPGVYSHEFIWASR